jgi:hypothetical protein
VAERTLTRGELNRALLARQLLLERTQLPLARAVERIGGIQNQYAPNAYMPVSCFEGFRREDLTRVRGRVRIAPLATVDQASRRELREEADRLADFHV